MKKQVLIQYDCYGGYNVSTSKNGYNWDTVILSESHGKSMVIVNAFREIGFDDVTDYEALEYHKDVKVLDGEA